MPLLPKGYDPPPSLGALVEQLSPAVVNLAGDGPAGGPEPFWGQAGQPGPSPGASGPGPVGRSLGSGFIVSPDGFLVTNAHLVTGLTRVTARLEDGRSLEAEVIGADSATDVALLRIRSDGKLPTVVLGDSGPLRVGDWVIALGKSTGSSPAVSAGIVSAREGQIGYGPYDEFMQTDAAINPGNSGGPLFDGRGTVVGINAAVGVGHQGLGFAVPIDLAKQVLPRLRAHGRVRRGWLGVDIQELTEDLSGAFDVPAGAGVLVSRVYPGSPAGRAGLEAGDVLIRLDAGPVAGARELTRRIAGLPPGRRVRLQVLRAGAVRTFKIRLAERAPPPMAPAPPGPGERAARLGLELAPLTPERAGRLGLDAQLRGLEVTGVDPGVAAASVLAVGDLILEVNRVAVADLDGLRSALAADPDRILLRVQRGQAQVYVVVRQSASGSGSGAR